MGTITLNIKLLPRLKMLKSAARRKNHKNLLFSLQRLSLILGLAAAGSLRALPVLASADIAIGGTQIDNQATGSYIDGDIPGAVAEPTVSNIVTVKVAEVAGINITAQVPTDAPGNAASYPNDASGTQLVPGPYQGFAGIHLGDIVYFDFIINNIGNDPTQFVIPNTAIVTNGTVGQLQIIEYGGTALTSPVNVPTSFNLNNNSTGALLNGVSGTNNGSIPANGSIKVRVPVIVTSGTGSVSVQLGDTSPAASNPASNQPYQATGTTDLYTRDNPNPATALTAAANNEVIGAPANGEREASASASVPIVGQSVSGNVFEDANYGGGSGRNKTASSGTNVVGATVELYDNLGKFVRSTTTDTNGSYTFPAVPVGDFYVRVVNDTVKSNRPGGTATGLLPVQTFLTDAGVTAGTVSPVTDRVGGETPSQSDTGAGAAGAIFSPTTKQFTTAGGTAAVNGYVQSLTKVKVGTVVVSEVDFGYNFDTIVNTNDSGQGSLRQFVANSNTLTNVGLAQVGQTAGKEVSIFMIPDGSAHPGLQATVPSQLTGNRALISLATPLTITDANTSIDGRTQTNNINNSNVLTLGTGGTVGVGGLTLASLSAPEIEITNSGVVANGIDVNGASATVRNIAIHGFGTAGSNQGDILLRAANAIVTENAIGTTALSFAAPTNQSQSGVVINGALAANISNNLIGFTNERGILGGNSTTAANLTGLVISGNEIRKTGNGTGTTNQHGGIELFPSTAGNVSILGNLITEAGTDSGIEINAGATGTATSFLIQNNSLSSNGSGTSGFGIVLQGTGANNINGINIDKNILDANRDGITSRQNNVTISENVVRNSIGTYGIGIEDGKQGNKITQNSTYGNAGPGIDIATATTANNVTANDGATDNTLSNKGIDYPLITATSLSGITLDVKGYVGISPAGNATFANVTLEFFLADNSPIDQNGEVIVGDSKSKPHGEGKTYLGSCTADGLGRFGTTGNLCTLTNAALTAGNYNNITATATDNINNNTSEFSAIPSTRAKLVLAKRITSITDGTTGAVISFNTYVNDPGTTEDDAANWPNVATTVLGETNGGQAKPGDIIEYAVYYRNAGENRISSAKVCDRLNTNLVYQEDFDALHVGSGIVLKPGSNTAQYLTGATGDDQGEFATTQPTDCNLINSTINATSNNVVVVQAANGTTAIPGLSDGYIKFKAKVKE
jgi:trimeric autotransporter adhesin